MAKKLYELISESTYLGRPYAVVKKIAAKEFSAGGNIGELADRWLEPLFDKANSLLDEIEDAIDGLGAEYDVKTKLKTDDAVAKIDKIMSEAVKKSIVLMEKEASSFKKQIEDLKQ